MLRVDQQIAFDQKSAEQHTVPMLVGDGFRQPLGFHRLISVKFVAERTSVGAQPSPQSLLLIRQIRGRPRLLDRQSRHRIRRGLIRDFARFADRVFEPLA
jgi:hypothetical protein